MKSCLTWFIGIIVGAAIGYGISSLIQINMYVAIVAGAILGSSFAITLNLKRSDENESHFEGDDSLESGDDKDPDDFPETTN
ncbi:MAG: hypothetical protein WD016_08950 [Balneolaceae bacterium]